MVTVAVSVFKVRSQVGGSKEPRRHKPVHVCDLSLLFHEGATGKDVHDRAKQMLGDDYNFTFKM